MNMRACGWCLLACLAAADTGRRLGYVMDDSTIKTAVTAWFDDRSGAEATYGHISTWDTSGVTDTSYLFCAASWLSSSHGCNTAAASFKEDIGAWDTSGVTTMDYMFYASAFDQDIGAWDTSGVTSMYRMFSYASAFNHDIGAWAVDNVRTMYGMFGGSAFNQDISGWAVHSVTVMTFMFSSALAFDQDLGWCVNDDVALDYAFDDTPCASTSCGVIQNAAGTCAPSPAPTPAPTVTPLVADDSTIRTAVVAWLSDATAAEATYGHISTWETGGVTDMTYLFCGYWQNRGQYILCNPAAASFNDDISAWDISGVTTTHGMFYDAYAFDQDIGDWAVQSVTSMEWMFRFASAFDQDLGWCVDDDVNLDHAFSYSGCASTSCGCPVPLTVRGTHTQAPYR